MAHVGEQSSIGVHDYEDAPYYSDADPREAGPEQFNLFTENGMVRLEENSTNEYGQIKRILLDGMGGLLDMNVVVHKNLYTSVDGNTKMQAFRFFSQAMAAKRGGGNANVLRAWYGGFRSEVADIVRCGFGRSGLHYCNGVGVHLSPTNAAIFSALRAVKDEYGVRHMLLCRVILGNTEIIPNGSKQFLPSSPNFDSGIDDPQAPKKFIIWTPYMNSHILPEYIISFKGRATGQISPPVSLIGVVNMLTRYLEPSRMAIVWKYYEDFRENKIQLNEVNAGLMNLLGHPYTFVSLINLCRDIVN